MKHQPDDRLDAYLWDPSAPPDERVVEIERRLQPARFDPRTRPLPHRGRVAHRTARNWSFGAWLPGVAAAAAILVIGGASFAAWRWTWPEGRAWPLRTTSASNQFAVGATLRTGPSENALVQIARIGSMRVAGATSLTLRSTSSNRHRLVMQEGSVHVRVWAPPFSIAFRTPAGEVSDLGCEFELSVTDQSTDVRVSSGWVQLENIHGEALVPAGASGTMTRTGRPAVPVFDDAATGFLKAVREHEASPADADPIDRIVILARPRDVFTLLHLVQRRSPAALRFVERAAELFPPPDDVDHRRVAAGDHRALDRWMSSLPLPSPKGTWLWNWRDGFSFFR